MLAQSGAESREWPTSAGRRRFLARTRLRSRAWRTLAWRTLERATVVCMMGIALLSTAGAAERGTMIRTAVIYVAPDVTSAKLATTDRGREAVVLERTPGWVHVIATLSDTAYSPDPQAAKTRNVSGWILDKGYISESSAKGDEILFGEAADSEDQASRSHGRKGARWPMPWPLTPSSAMGGPPVTTSANCLQPDGQNDNGWDQGLLFLNPSQVWSSCQVTSAK